MAVEQALVREPAAQEAAGQGSGRLPSLACRRRSDRGPGSRRGGLTVEETTVADTGLVEEARPGLLDGVTVIDLGQIYQRAVCDSASRSGRRQGDQGRAARGRAQPQASPVSGLWCRAPLPHAERQQVGRYAQPEDPRGAGAAAGDGRAGRRVGGELPAGSDGAARPRARDPARPAPVPDLHVEASGFGRDSPYGSLAAMDVTIQAMSGAMAATGYSNDPPVKQAQRSPTFSPGSTCAAAS